MNSTARYEKIGKVVYGSVRLASAVRSSSEWLSAEAAKDITSTKGANINEPASVEVRFFDKSPRFAHLKGEYLRILEAVKALQASVPNLINANEDELDAYLKETQQVHYALADVIEELEFSKELPYFLRLSVTPKSDLSALG